MRQVVLDHGHEYMLGRTNELLASGALTLGRTATWIHDSLEAAVATPQTFAVIARTLQLEDKLDFYRRLVGFDRDAVCYLHDFAVVHLVTANTDKFTVDTIPEALRFDYHRLAAARNASKYLVAACTFITRIVQTAQNIVRTFTEARPMPFSEADARDVLEKEKSCQKVTPNFSLSCLFVSKKSRRSSRPPRNSSAPPTASSRARSNRTASASTSASTTTSASSRGSTRRTSAFSSAPSTTRRPRPTRSIP